MCKTTNLDLSRVHLIRNDGTDNYLSFILNFKQHDNANDANFSSVFRNNSSDLSIYAVFVSITNVQSKRYMERITINNDKCDKCSFEVRATTMEGRIQCDYCVVGAGMIGSAAAKHLQVLNPSSKVVLVGPTEPKVTHRKIILEIPQRFQVHGKFQIHSLLSQYLIGNLPRTKGVSISLQK